MIYSTRIHAQSAACILLLTAGAACAEGPLPTLRECKVITAEIAEPGGKLAQAVDELHQANSSPTSPVCDYLRAAYSTAGDVTTTLINCDNATASTPEEISTVAEARRLYLKIGQLRDQIREVAIAKGCVSR